MHAIVIILMSSLSLGVTDYYSQLQRALAILSLGLCNTPIAVSKAETPTFIDKETETQVG